MKTSKVPVGTFTMPSRDALMSVEGFAEWAATKRSLPQNEYMAFVHVADTRLDKFPKPDRTRVFPAISVWHVPRIYADNIHQHPAPALAKVYDALLRLHTWYANPKQSERLQRRATTRANGNSKLSVIESARRVTMAPLLRQAHLHLRGDLPDRQRRADGTAPPALPDMGETTGTTPSLIPALSAHQLLAQTIRNCRPPNLVMQKSPVALFAHNITPADFAAAAAAELSQSPALSIEAEGHTPDDAGKDQPTSTAGNTGDTEHGGSGTAHTSAAASPEASEDEGSLTQPQSRPASPTPSDEKSEAGAGDEKPTPSPQQKNP
jgi:hypothetical protein